MKVLVCGGREFENGEKVSQVLSAFHAAQPIVRLIEGGARGADALAREWARSAGILVDTYLADWKRYGKRAGPIRNTKMLEASEPDVVIAFPGGAGTAHMVKIAKAAGVEVLIITEKGL